jgi:hypothetical protein
MTKQFKIGEYAVGGIIRVGISKTNLTIDALDWTTKNIVIRHHYSRTPWSDYASHRKFLFKRVDEALHDLTSSYYADKILTFIKANI